MAQKERENFFRNSTVLVDYGNEAFAILLEYELSKINISFVDFITLEQHTIYHLCYNGQCCCQCVNGVKPKNTPRNRVLYPNQLEKLLDKVGQKFPCHKPGTGAPCCCSPANPNLIIKNLDITLIRCLLNNFFTASLKHNIQQSIEDLVRYRNSYAHATEAKIPDADYTKYKKDIESALMSIARYCSKECDMAQKLKDAETRPLDESICLQYQITLLSEIQQMLEMEKKIEKIQDTLEAQEDIIAQWRKSFIEQTEIRIRDIMTQGYINRNVVTYCCSQLEETNILALVSKRGGGKSCSSLQIAAQFQSRGYETVLFVNDEWSTHRELINFNAKHIYILEDFFGRENPQFNENKRGILDFLYSGFKIQNPECGAKLVLSFSTGQPCSDSITDKHAIFQNTSVVDLDSICHLEERKKIFEYHLQKNNISLCSPSFDFLDFCRKKCETDVIENDDKSLTLCSRAFSYICGSEYDSDIGFPELCRSFCIDESSRKMGAFFFCRISTPLANEIKTMFVDAFSKQISRYQIAILMYVAMLRHINIDDFDDEFFKTILCLFKKNSSVDTILFRTAFNSIKGKYLQDISLMHPYSCIKRRKFMTDSEFCLQYCGITDALLLACGQSYEDIINIKLEGRQIGIANAREKIKQRGVFINFH